MAYQDADYALFGGTNYSGIPANMLNADAADQYDFGTILTNGIKGAAINAMNGMINGAYASGQLQAPRTVQAAPNVMNLLIVGAVLYFVLGK